MTGHPDGYCVHFDNGETHHYDNVTVLDSGWLSCYLHQPPEKRNFKFPPRRIHAVESGDNPVIEIEVGE
jgi:hypothetical protein